MVDTKKVPIALVSLGPQNFCGTINERLNSLGYQNVGVFGYDDLLDIHSDYSNNVYVFPLSNRKSLHVRMHSALTKIKAKPVLSIIQTPENNSNINLLDYSNEFLCWPFPDNEFALRLDRLYAKYQIIPETPIDARILEEFIAFNLVGSSPPFLFVLSQIKKIARCDAPVLIEGATGTGKELAARAIHYLSERQDYPFIPVNCGAIPDSLMESELFGHEKGAFTDAKQSYPGIISQSEGGTLFLDEVEALTKKGQVALLRFLENQQYKPLGCCQQRQANVRVVVASNAKLSDLVDQGAFRQDLFFRLNIMSIEMPPLSQRAGDIELLADYFLNKYKQQYGRPEKFLLPETIEWMKNYSWPGNIRELENILYREFVLTEGPYIKLGESSIQKKDRRESLLDRRQDQFFTHSFNDAKTKIITQFEKRYLRLLMQEANGNVTQAAKRAGKERRALGKLLKKHGIEKPNTHKT